MRASSTVWDAYLYAWRLSTLLLYGQGDQLEQLIFYCLRMSNNDAL